MEEEINNTSGQTDAPAQAPIQASAPQLESADEMAQLSKEYPEIIQGRAAVLPQEVLDLRKGGMKLLDAFRLYDLHRVRGQYAALGSVAGGQAREKDYYTSQEWDRLPGHLKEKFIKNGKIFEFMKKWSV